jgi:hypothetical protein
MRLGYLLVVLMALLFFVQTTNAACEKCICGYQRTELGLRVKDSYGCDVCLICGQTNEDIIGANSNSGASSGGHNMGGMKMK